MNNDFSLRSYPPSCAGGLYGIGSDYEEKIKAYVFQFECPYGHDDGLYPIPEEKRELGATDKVYRDEECIAILLEKFPCYCSEMGMEEWVFEFEEPDGQNTIGKIAHNPYIQYGWYYFGFNLVGGPPMPCFYSDLWHIYNFYQTRYINCNKNEGKFGIWKLRFKYIILCYYIKFLRYFLSPKKSYQKDFLAFNFLKI